VGGCVDLHPEDGKRGEKIKGIIMRRDGLRWEQGLFIQNTLVRV
jgi:hypothetical protein